ncbi:MAG TPA: hypothetical protein VNZ44_08140 [Pyrinomonadaceae bacterium]|nr:hypothetical protein [Pyrinomonadaceae bacterium]
MNSFRKHAPGNTQRPNSLLKPRAHAAAAAALLLTLLLVAPFASAAPRQQKEGAKSRDGQTQTAEPGKTENGARGAAEKTESGARGGAEASAADPRIPVRVTRVNTPEGPAVVATIGEFPDDLNEAGQDFLKREFFEHFASDVLGLGDSGEERATLKVAMLPQEKENQRECDFTAGKVSGHIVVLVEKRRVFIACTFSEVGQKPQLLAGIGPLKGFAAPGV